MSVKNNRASAALLLTVGTVCCNTEVLAQSSPALEEIVVTARKREEAAQDVPIAITAVSAQTISDQNIEGIYDLVRITPSLNIVPDSYGPLGAIVSLRGQRTGDTLLTQQQAVGIYEDGVYLAGSQGQAISNMWDIERVEVLKGPQGTLFGRNTTGGAISITSKLPTDEWEGDLKVGYGRFNAVDLAATLNVPFSPIAAMRLTAQSIKDDGYGEEVTSGKDLGVQDTQTYRATFRLNPTDDFEVILRGSYTDATSTGQPKEIVFAQATCTNPAAITVAVLNGLFTPSCPPVPTSPFPNAPLGAQVLMDSVPSDPYKTAYSFEPYQDFYGKSGSLTLSYHFSDALTVKSISSYQKTNLHSGQDTDGSPYEILDSYNTDREVEAFTQEITLTGAVNDGRLQWVLGGFYFDTNGTDFDGFAAVPVLAALGFPGVGPQSTLADVDTKSTAVYTQATYALTDRLDVTAGLRYTDEQQDLTATNTLNGRCVVGTPPGAPCEAKFDTDDNNLSYLLTFSYDITDGTLAYLRTARGFKGGGLNPRGASGVLGESFDPEEVTDYEVGIKSELLDRRLRINADYYYSDYQDIQRTVIIGGGGISSAITNAAEATVQGVELEVAALATDKLLLSLSGAYTDAKFDKYVDGAGNDLSDRKFTFPKWQYSASATYTQPTGAGELRGVVTWSWQDDIDYQPENHGIGVDPKWSTQEAYGLLGARLSLNVDAWNTEVAAWGRNLLDKEYITYALDVTSAGFGFVLNNFAAPRSYGLELIKHF